MYKLHCIYYKMTLYITILNHFLDTCLCGVQVFNYFAIGLSRYLETTYMSEGLVINKLLSEQTTEISQLNSQWYNRDAGDNVWYFFLKTWCWCLIRSKALNCGHPQTQEINGGCSQGLNLICDLRLCYSTICSLQPLKCLITYKYCSKGRPLFDSLLMFCSFQKACIKCRASQKTRYLTSRKVILKHIF